MYAVVGETLGADEFEAKFFKGKVGLNNFVREETQSVKIFSGGVPRQWENFLWTKGDILDVQNLK